MSGQGWTPPDLSGLWRQLDEAVLGDFVPDENAPTVEVRKVVHHMPISTDLAVEYGLISEEEARASGWTPPPPPPPVPWHRRLRWRWYSLRNRLGRKVGGWIAGEELSERDE